MTVKQQIINLAALQKAVLEEIKRMPKITGKSTKAQFDKFSRWAIYNDTYLVNRIKDMVSLTKDIYYSYDLKPLGEKPTKARPGTKPVKKKKPDVKIVERFRKSGGLPATLKRKLKNKR